MEAIIKIAANSLRFAVRGVGWAGEVRGATPPQAITVAPAVPQG
jgi:hypothetical protein